MTRSAFINRIEVRRWALVCIIAAFVTGTASGDESPATRFAFVGVNVLPMTSATILENRTVLVGDGRIEAIGPASEFSVPADALVIEAVGKYLMPGLADMHAHITPPTEPKTTPELLLYLATGVTTLRNMAGKPGDLALRKAILDREVLGPRLMLASPLLEGEDAVWDFSMKVLAEDEARARVYEFAAQGYDFIKIYHTLDAGVYRAVIDEARKRNIRVVGHVPFSIGVEEVIAAGQSSIEHLRGYDIDGLTLEVLAKDGGRSPERFGSWLNMSDKRMADLARQTAAAAIWNTPTLVVNMQLAEAEQLPELADHPMARYMTPKMRHYLTDSPLLEIFSPESRAMLRRVLPQQYRFIKALHDAGAPLMIGTDTLPVLVPGFTVIDEIGHFVKAGLTPYEALYAATVAPAGFSGDPGANGTVIVGQRADLILLDANPLEDVSHLWQLDGVMVQGEWHARAALLELIEQRLVETGGTEETEPRRGA